MIYTRHKDTCSVGYFFPFIKDHNSAYTHICQDTKQTRCTRSHAPQKILYSSWTLTHTVLEKCKAQHCVLNGRTDRQTDGQVQICLTHKGGVQKVIVQLVNVRLECPNLCLCTSIIHELHVYQVSLNSVSFSSYKWFLMP